MSVARGLARNPSVPVSVLTRLLSDRTRAACDGIARRPSLPVEVQELMAGHPDEAVRRTVARHPDISVALREGLLFADPSWWVRLSAVERSSEQRPFSDAALDWALFEAAHPSGDPLMTPVEAWDEAFGALWRDPRFVMAAARHPDPAVRLAIAWSPPTFPVLADDPDPEVRARSRASAVEHVRPMRPADLPGKKIHRYWSVLWRPLSRELADQVLAAGDVESILVVAANLSVPAALVLDHQAAVVRARAAARDDLTPDQVARLVADSAPKVRSAVAARDDLTPAQLARLAADGSIEVRTAVSVHPGLTEQQRAGLDITVPPMPGGGAVPSPETAREWATSVNPLLRRRAAREPSLPASLLAGDPDFGVRLLLALHNDAPPPGLLLDCYLAAPSPGLLARAAFPSSGLARFADDPAPENRLLVARDPEADPVVVWRLCSSDPSAMVRAAMAECPRLPPDRILELLRDPSPAEFAAANPALPFDAGFDLDAVLDSGLDSGLVSGIEGAGS